MHNNFRASLAAVLFCLAAWPASVDAAQPFRHGEVVPVMNATTPDFAARRGPRWQVLNLSDGYGMAASNEAPPMPVNSVRLHFADIEDHARTDYQVVVTGPRGVIVRWSRGEFAVRKSFWSPELAASSVTVDVVAAKPPVGLAFRIDARTVSTVTSTRHESIIGRNDIERLHARLGEADVAAVAGSVAMLRIVQDGLAVACSGVLVDREMILTNQHCIRSQGDCATTTVWFGHHYLVDGRLAPGDEQIGCHHIVSGPDSALDYALIRLGAPATRWPVAPFAAAPPCPPGGADGCTPPRDMFLIHHPAGAPKMVTRMDCAIARSDQILPVAFGHTCDSDRGSSGAPIFAGGRIVGLHHAGHESRECTACINEAIRAELISAAIEAPREQPSACPWFPGDPMRSIECPGG